MTIKELENQISNLQTKLEKLKQAEKEKNTEESKNILRPWREEEGGGYYHINSSGKAFSEVDVYIDIDDEQYTFGNYYYTKELAEQDAKELKLRNIIRQYRDMLCKNYKYNPCKDNWYIVFYTVTAKYDIGKTFATKEIGQIYFDTKEHAQMVCDILNAELN